MRHLIIILFITISFTIKAQNHSLGLGYGINNISTLNIELNYNYSYKLFYSKINLTHAPIKASLFNNLSQSYFLIGIKPSPKKNVAGHYCIGIRNLHPTHNYEISKNSTNYEIEEQLYFQTNFCLNLGLNIRFNKNHSMFTDIYISGYNILYNNGRNKEYLLRPYTGISIGYSYTFCKKTIK